MGRNRVPLAAVVVCACLVACGGAEDAGFGFGVLLLRTTLLLVLVGGLAVVTLRLAAKHGIGRRQGSGRLEVLEELPISARESILAVRALDRVLVVSRSPSGMRTLADYDAAEWSRASFAQVLARTDADGVASPGSTGDGGESETEMVA